MAIADKSRLGGVRYGATSEAGFYSNQAMDHASAEVLSEAIVNAGSYSSSPYETYYEPVYHSSKAGIVQYYKDVYGDRVGKGGWKDALAKDFAAFTGGKVASVKKSLNPERINQSGARQGWDKFGRTLPPSAYIPKERPRKRQRAKVSFSIYFKISNSHKRASHTSYLNDSETLRLMEQGDFDAVLEAWGLNNIDMLEELDIGEMSVELVD